MSKEETFFGMSKEMDDALIEFTEHVSNIWDKPENRGMPARHLQVILKQFIYPVLNQNKDENGNKSKKTR